MGDLADGSADPRAKASARTTRVASSSARRTAQNAWVHARRTQNAPAGTTTCVIRPATSLASTERQTVSATTWSKISTRLGLRFCANQKVRASSAVREMLRQFCCHFNPVLACRSETIRHTTDARNCTHECSDAFHCCSCRDGVPPQQPRPLGRSLGHHCQLAGANFRRWIYPMSLSSQVGMNPSIAVAKTTTTANLAARNAKPS